MSDQVLSAVLKISHRLHRDGLMLQMMLGADGLALNVPPRSQTTIPQQTIHSVLAMPRVYFTISSFHMCLVA